MLKEDIKYLKCIDCGKDLRLQTFTDKKEECIEGVLCCRGCKAEWPVIQGVPRLLSRKLLKEIVVSKYPEFFKKHKLKGITLSTKEKDLKSRTADSFGFEWLAYPKILSQFERDWARYFNPYIYKKDIKGLVVADFGCGMAKHGYFIGKYNAKKYIGVDLSEAVDAAYDNTNKFNSLIVQADIYSLPLKGEIVDLFYSIGVLHHLPDPEKGFQSITKLMKKNSRIFIWVYGKHNNKRAKYLYDPIRLVTTKIPKKLLYGLCYVPASALHAANESYKFFDKVGLKRIAKLHPFKYYSMFPFRFKVSDSFDVFATPKQVYYEMNEIDGWFNHAGLKNHKLAFDEFQGIKGFAVKK
ncbi:MAG: class I SAM-dependent methyltransferase [Candidatus Nanoarchaeia archaeon]